jgi:hypothetical protein
MMAFDEGVDKSGAMAGIARRDQLQADGPHDPLEAQW